MIPDYQTLMLPVLRLAEKGETRISDAVDILANEFGLTDAERAELLPSGKQARFANRVHWARSYLKQAGLLKTSRRGYFVLSDVGRDVLMQSPDRVDNAFLERFAEFREFKERRSEPGLQDSVDTTTLSLSNEDQTPDEALREAHASIMDTLAADILEKLREADPGFFESVIVQLLLKMGFGAGDTPGTTLGKSGDDGVDGVINLDALGVDQVFVQAKRYNADNPVGAGAIRDFYGALGLKDVTKGIFVTTSHFSESAKQTASKLGARIILVDGKELARLMVANEVGCRVTEVLKLAVLEESYFE